MASDEKSKVLERLKAYNFNETTLTEHLIDTLAKYSYNTHTTTYIKDEQKIKKANYNPALKLGERWHLDSVDHRIPTEKERAAFNKNHNQDKYGASGKIADTSWHIVAEDLNYLKVSFRFEPNGLPELFSFLGKCIGYAYFNKKTKKLERAQFINEEPVRFHIFQVKDLEVNIYYSFNTAKKKYFVDKEVAELSISLLGNKVQVKEICRFSNYKKVK
ncbi:hypothetical protein SAMN05216474_0371 [Lishizhenia tianjinensis]|uniref:Uncharacterized protein n=2 Tax=Lishizhenia tianjinensis TaxID=477690 RepID=A0A1I6XR45_9FLAO|nr:hypothetical protein SAMN05216474_0371 [Lishizhenia tianjinensis]